MADSKVLRLAMAVLATLLAHACGFPNVPKMRARTVRHVGSRACVRWLSRNHVHGCVARVHGAPNVLLRFQDRRMCPDGAKCAVLATCDEAKDALEASADVAGVLLDARARPASLSFVGKHPQMQFEASEDQKHVWNDAEQIALVDDRGYLGHLDIPVYLLQERDAQTLTERAIENMERIQNNDAMYAIDMNLDMKAANDPHSIACLRHGTCLPLGGYSVVAATQSNSKQEQRVGKSEKDAVEDVVVMFSIDGGFGMFRDNVTAAREAMAGMIATLVAAEALAQAPKVVQHTRRIVFAGMAGDGFGYMGTRRFWTDWNAGRGSTVQRLGAPNISYVINVGSLGKPKSGAQEDQSEAHELYFHPTTQGASNEALVQALEWASQAPEAPSLRQSAPKSGKGLPPSSLQALVDVDPNLVGMVLTDFDSAIGNPYLGGFYDNVQEVDLERVARSAILLANTLHALHTGLAGSQNTSHVEYLQMPLSRTQERINDLADCVMRPSVGFNCKAARELFLVNDHELFSHYVGVLPSYRDEDTLELGSKNNMQKLLWNILGAAVADSDYVGESCQGVCSSPGEVCLGYRSSMSAEDRVGTCKRAEVGYTVSLEPAFEYAQNNKWRVVADPSDPYERAPLFTESYWGSEEDLRVLSFLALTQKQSNLRLVAGTLATGFSIIIAFAVRRLHDKRHKWH
mmetsp:Transcript_4691/g.29587  ORF Transcript_4691/g.29587 Transcript_4691/m.29587 type:complete len:687 (+) Transcript_4691:1443-3503(+)